LIASMRWGKIADLIASRHVVTIQCHEPHFEPRETIPNGKA
jgi:hypothetical protein